MKIVKKNISFNFSPTEKSEIQVDQNLEFIALTNPIFRKAVSSIKLLGFFLCLFFINTSAAISIGGTTTGAEIYCTSTNSGIVTVTGYVGTILNWQSTTDGGIIWNSIANPGANQTYFNLNQTTCYRAIVKDGIFPPDTSTIVCITIYPPSIGGTISGGGSFCDSSGSGILTLTGYSGNILYWLSSTNNGAAWSTIPDTTNLLNYTSISQNTLYAAIVRSNPSCPVDTSTQVNFIVDPLTVPGTINGAGPVCISANSGTLTVTGQTGAVLGWESSINNGTSWTQLSNTTVTQTYLNLNQTTWYRAIIQSGMCAVDTTPKVIMTVSPVSIGGTINGGGIYCGIPASGTLTLTGYTGDIVSWASSINSGSTWSVITNTTALENYSNLPVTTIYIAIIQSGACPADTSSTEIVNVSPQTVAGIIAESSIACIGANLDTLRLSGNIGNISQWLVSTDNGATWNSIANTTTMQPYYELTQTTLYAAVVQSGVCNIDTTAPVTITIVQLPSVNAGDDISINQGESIIINGAGTGTPLWTPALGLNDPAIFLPTASPASTTTYILTVTDSNNCVNSDTTIVTITQSIFNGKVSTLFTPNGDGINDNWYIEGIQNFADNEVTVYNIYGKTVFDKKAYANDWQGTFNGTDLPDGTYYYVIKFDNADTILKGALDILRSK